VKAGLISGFFIYAGQMIYAAILFAAFFLKQKYCRKSCGNIFNLNFLPQLLRQNKFLK